LTCKDATKGSFKTKLVRDKIPDLLTRSGKKIRFYQASDEEYWIRLKEKLLEEVEEFFTDETLEEMADILEVLEAICLYKKFNQQELKKTKKVKKKERGGFLQKKILTSKDIEA
jgi:predicted house-cleaning noncanonical NTP pyrophosphatase (MazG superfamily)